MSDHEETLRLAMQTGQEVALAIGERDRLRDEVAWLRSQIERLTPVPAAAPSRETPSIPDCAHQWASDTRGTFCVKCGEFSSTTFPSFVSSGLGGVGGAET